MKFHQAMFQANLLYGVDLDQDDFEEIGLIAWGKIGNKNVRTFRYTVPVDCNTKSIQLPCNCDMIESVTMCGEDWNGNLLASAHIENYIESTKTFKDTLYTNGKFVKYERVGDTLYFDNALGSVTVTYRGILVDDLGLPELNEKEVNAIACYIAYTVTFKEGLVTRNANTIQLANTLKIEWNNLLDDARTPEYISQNDMDKILDSKTSWNRKLHNKSYKLYL